MGMNMKNISLIKKFKLFFYGMLVLLMLMPIIANANVRALCSDPRISCETVERGETWYSLFPDDTDRILAMRLNRQNTRLHVGETIAVPKNLNNSNVMEFSPFPKERGATGRKVIIVNLGMLAFGAYDESGHLVHWGPASGGRGWCPDLGRGCHSPVGSFAIYNKGGAGCVSSKYPLGEGGAPMPYCMFFHGNYALHGSPLVPGFNASHGCIRMFTQDAEWLNEEFADIGTQVIVSY